MELAGEKTRLIEFGRYAAERRASRGERKPETFEFLGFTHICAKDRHGRFKLKRITSKKRTRAKLSSVKTELMRRRHLPIPDQGRWLASALRGHYDYYAVPDNGASLRGFRWRVTRHWLRAQRRRSQRTLSSACVSGQGIALLRVWPLRADRAVAGAARGRYVSPDAAHARSRRGLRWDHGRDRATASAGERA